MDKSGRGARILLKFTGQPVTFFICVCVFISGLLNDSILNFG